MLLVPGMIFTIEPMINMGKPGIFIDEENGWTVITIWECELKDPEAVKRRLSSLLS